MGVYCRAEEFRSVKFFVSTVGKADRQARRRSQARIQADRLERSTLPGRKLGSIAGLWAGHSISTQCGGKQCFGSGSGLDPDSIGSLDPDPDWESGSGSRGKKSSKNKNKK